MAARGPRDGVVGDVDGHRRTALARARCVLRRAGRGPDRLPPAGDADANVDTILSVGSDENVQEGFTFTVYDRDRFVGKVKVETVMNDMCGARVLFTEPGETIEAGQKASTRL